MLRLFGILCGGDLNCWVLPARQVIRWILGLYWVISAADIVDMAVNQAFSGNDTLAYSGFSGVATAEST